MNIHLGIDPGEQWTGIALLIETRWNLYTQSIVMSASDGIYRPAIAIANLIEGVPGKHHIAMEQYRVRPVGHQRWTTANAVRLIGAIEFVANYWLEIDVSMIPPGSIEDLKPLGLMDVTEDLRGEHWEHALSAWRVLGLDLAQTKPLNRLLEALRCPVEAKSTPRTIPTLTQSPIDLISPFRVFSKEAIR